MNLRILLIMFLVVFTSCEEKSKEATKEKETTELQFTNAPKGSKHVHIPATRMFIIPPKGFKVAKAFAGLEKNDDIIQIMDLPEGDFYSNSRNYSRETLENSDVKVYDYKELKVGKYPAKYLKISEGDGLKVINLIFGDDTFCVSINAFFQENNEKLEEAIIKSLQTIYYDIDFKADPLENAQFTLDENASRFKFTKSGGNILIYTYDGVDKKTYENEPLVLVSSLPVVEDMTLRSVSEELISGLEEQGLVVSEIKNKKSKTVNDIRMYEMEVHGSAESKNSVIYLLIAVNYDAVVVLQGITRPNFKEDLAEVKKLANTLKLKN